MTDEVEEVIWQYVVGHEAWYAPKHTEPTQRISVLKASSLGGAFWEFVIEWTDLGSMVPSVRMFDDSWEAFIERPDLFAGLASVAAENAEPDAIADLLDSLGFVDATDRVDPDGAAEPADQLAMLVEEFRRSLMVAHAHDWSMDMISDAAHICAKAAMISR